MAGSGNSRGGRRATRYNRTDRRPQAGRTNTYVEGTAVRRLDSQEKKHGEQKMRRVSPSTRKNRERALQMNVGYVLFLTAAAVITVIVCVNFLQLRAQGTLLREEVTSLSADLDSAKLENDSDYNRVMSSVDLEHVRDVAMNELGMVQPQADQIVTYKVEDGDYVRQYSDIPAE